MLTFLHRLYKNPNPMASVSTADFKNGLKVLLDNDPHSIVSNEFVKPGKGQAFNRVRLKNLITRRIIDRTFKSGEKIELADVLDTELQYLYNDGSDWHFMDPASYNQFVAAGEAVAEAAPWIKAEDLCKVTLHNGKPIQVLAPNFVSLTVTETEPGVRGDTATGGSKSATLETGASIKVPLFVEQGEAVKVDTRTGEYMGRDK